jgi:hypothetical protein
MEMLAASGMFGNRIDVPEADGRQAQLLGLLGRQDAR